MNLSSAAIADLQARWHTLKDSDRALAILPIIQSGISRRKLALALNCSESLVRRLLRMLDASPEDLDLGRWGLISGNELVRRSHANLARHAAQCREIERQKREKAIEEGHRSILRWLTEDPLRAGSAEQIIEEARFRLNWCEEAGKLPRGTAPVGMPLGDIVRHCRPEKDTDELDVSWHATWLFKWVFYSIVDGDVRWNALYSALEQAFPRF